MESKLLDSKTHFATIYHFNMIMLRPTFHRKDFKMIPQILLFLAPEQMFFLPLN